MAVTTSNAKPYWGNGHYYAYTGNGESWTSASSSSRASTLNGLTGYLATVTSAEENDFITNYSKGGAALTNDALLGGTDVQSEGTWIWDTGPAGPEDGTVFRRDSSDIGYTKWDDDQPNNEGNQDYLRIIHTDGQWGDIDPGDASGYITEWGQAGAQFVAQFGSLSNGFEGGSAPKIEIRFDRRVLSDYVNIRNGTPLIDIPITFGGTAVKDRDYTLEEIAGDSYYANGRLYVLNTDLVTLRFIPNPRDSDTWNAPRTITLTLQADGSENIYAISGSTSSQVRLFDDEPQLSLGQGAYQFIRTPYTTGITYSLPANNSGFSNTGSGSDVLVFDADGINETESGLANQGLYDSFAIRWETYIRIPETGSYVFRTTTDDGSKLTLRKSNGAGPVLYSHDHYWNSNTLTPHATQTINLNKGEVVWLQFDYFVDASGAGANAAKLSWDRPNGSGGTVSNEVVPASAMFLSESLARGLNRQESSSDTTSLGFQLFANKSTSRDINIKLSSSSETANSTVGTTLAKRQTGSTQIDGDYAIVDSSGAIIDSSLIGLNSSFGNLGWQPTAAFGALTNLKSYNVNVLRDDYAEITESISFSLGSGSGYGVSNASQTITIADDPRVLSLTQGQDPTEGGDSDSDLGWFTIKANKAAPEGGLVIRYQITGGTAVRGSDYTAPQATRTTGEGFKAEDLVVMPYGSSEARIYIAAIADAIREGSETLTLRLLANVETNNQGFSFQRYNIDSANSQASLTINDSSADQPAVVITPADRTGLATVRAQLVNGRQQAAFEVRLTSQPRAAVAVSLSSSSGNLSSTQVNFNSSNWTQPQRITLTDLRNDQPTTVTAAGSSSDDFYNMLTTTQGVIPSGWATDLQLSLWEGGGLVASAPAASVQAIDGSEGSTSRLGFELKLASPVVAQPVELLYRLSGSDGFTLEGNAADALHTPQVSYRPLELRNGSSSGGSAYAEFSNVRTVSDKGEFSAAAWVRRDAVSTEAALLEFSDSNGSNRILLGFHDTSGRPQLEIRDANGALLLKLIADNEVSLQEWNHLAFSVDAGGVARLYLNGEQAAQAQLSRPAELISRSRSFNSIGRSALASAGSSALVGAVRGVSIWNAFRSQEQIQASMLAANASSTGLVSAFPLNGTGKNSVAGAPDVVLHSGTSNTAAFATTPFYGLQVPVNEASISLPLVAIDDLTAEGTERLTLTLLDGGRYSIGGASGSATADLSDNETAEVLFLTAAQTDGSSSALTWTNTSQFRVSEADAGSKSSTRLGIRLSSQPQGNVTLSLNTASYSSAELRVSNPLDPTAQTLALTFTPGTWADVQELRLQGVDDNQDDGDSAQSLSFTLSSSDANYGALRPTLSVLNVDNDATTNSRVATGQSQKAPLASLSGPSQKTIHEAGNDSVSFTVSLDKAAPEDTLLFLEVDPRLSQVLANDVSVSVGNGAQSLAGLTRFDSNAGGAETTRLDADGINESAASFQNNNQSGAFNSTWSGYLYIPESGSYNFSVPVQGGVRLRLNGATVIDKLFDSKATWSTGNLQFSRGNFVGVSLDYQSFATSAPSVALQWQRPSEGGTEVRNEVVPAQYLSRSDGFSLLIPKGSSSGSLTLRGIQDWVDERDEDLAISLLASRGVELLITGQSGPDQLQATFATCDREAITLPAGTELSLGKSLEGSETQPNASATFTLAAAATIHRDRSTTLSGSLVWKGQGGTSADNSSVVGLVAGYGSSGYQVLDTSVALTLLTLDANSSGVYLASFRLEPTNQSNVTIPAGTTLTYVKEGSDVFLSLVLSNNLTLQSGQTATNIATTIVSQSSGLVPEAATNPLLNLSSAYVLPNNTIVRLLDDEEAGLQFSLDAAGSQPVNTTRVDLNEQGSGVTRYARLRTQPSNTVTVYLETTDASEAVLKLASSSAPQAESRIALTFTPNNWQTAQAFTILPANDDLVDGDVNVDIQSRSTSGDGFYAISSAGTLPFQVKDDDVPGVAIELQQSSISKAGNGSINLRLTAQPSADVGVKLVPNDGQFTINQASIGRSETLLFTPANWSTLQSVSLWAVDDQITGEDISSSQLQLSTASDDIRFNALSIKPVQIDIVDNDPPQAEIILVSDSSEEAKPGRFQIQLAAPAPQSAGSTGVLVNYTVTQVNLDPGLGYANTPQGSISKITQTPGAISGQVRIAPGKTSSDLIVVPIDDIVQDSINKSFTVQLLAGDGYILSNNSASNSASVQIINNDKAGIALLTTGDRVLIKETGQSASFQLALLTQPTTDVIVTISENYSEGNRQLGSSGTPFSQQITFTASNWYVPKQISVQAYDDGRIEDGSGEKQFTGIHEAQLSYHFQSTDPNYDTDRNLPNHFTHLVQDVDVLDYELPKQTADALQSSLTSLQEGIDSLSLPIVGSLDGKAGAGLRKFITSLVNSVRQIGTPTPKKLSKLLSQEIAGALGIPENTVTVTLDPVMTTQNTTTIPDAVAVSFAFKDSYDIVSVPLAADFGLPGLGFQSQGSLDAEFNYEAALRLVFPRKGDIYLDTQKIQDTTNTHLSAKFITHLSDDFSLTGGLGFLQLDAVNQVSENVKVAADTGLDVSFNLDLSGDAGINGLTLNELMGELNLEKLFQYQLAGNAAMSFGVTTSINGSAAIPSFSFDLSSKLPLFDYSNQEKAKEDSSATSFYFDNINLDLGTFITDMLSPIVDGLDTILNPLYPIVDALYTDTQIFATLGLESSFDKDKDGHVTTIDLASWFADFYAMTSKPNDPKAKQLQDAISATTKFLDLLKDVIDLVRDLKAMSEEGNFYVDYGNYELPLFKAADPKASTDKDSEKLDKDPNATKNLNKDTAEQADKGGSKSKSPNNGDSKSPDDASSNDASEKFKKIMAKLDKLGFKIPLIDEPKNAIKLLLGQNVDLFTWTMPPMGMSSEVEKRFPISSGIEGIIEGGFGVEANLGFGFDTYGLNQWKKGGFKANDAWKVFDGFYVADEKKDPDTEKYVDVPEFSMDASMGAGLGLTALVVRSDITGGLAAATSFDLLDEGEVAGTSDGKIRGSEMSRITNPLDLFELVGSLSAYLKANVQVGVDMGLYSIWDTVWEEKLAQIPLFEFGVGGSYGSGTASNGYLQGTTVFWDGNQNLRIDPYEPSTITGEEAHYNLRIEHRSFDLNRNGTIDSTEGNLIAFGGVDTSTGLALEVPFLAPLGKMITPLTTLHSLALAQGLHDKAAAAWIDQAFGLNGFDYLRRDPVLELKQPVAAPGARAIGALATYIAHIKLHFGWEVLVQSLQQLLSDQFPEAIETELPLITAYNEELLALPASTPIMERLATAALGSLRRLRTELPSEVTPLAALAVGLAANANWDLCQQIDALFAAAKQGNSHLSDTLDAINQLKRDAFAHYRSETDAISQGLYKINDPALLERSVQQRLATVYRNFVKDHPLQSGSEDAANGLIRLLDLKDWSLSENAILTTTPFTTIQSLAQKGITLSDRVLDFALRQRNNSGPITGGDLPVSVLINLERFGLPQRTADAALTYFVDMDLRPTPFLYDANSRTGARFFNLGSGLSRVVELNHLDSLRGDLTSDAGVIRGSGSVAELKQNLQLHSSPSSNEVSIVPSDASDRRAAAVFAHTELINRAISSNQYGYLVLGENEFWDPLAISIGELRERMQILGGSLENHDLPQLSLAMNAQRELQFSSGTRLVFLEVMGNVLGDLGEADAPVASLMGAQISVLNAVETTTANSLRLQSSTSGIQLQIDLKSSESGLAGFLARQQSQVPLLDFSGLADMRIHGTLEISREADYDSIVGFYQVLDTDGTVFAGIDPISGERRFLGPTDGEAYRNAALSADNLVEPLSNLLVDDLGLSSRNLTIRSGMMLAPFAIVETGEASHTYFAFKEANADRIEHFQMQGDNVFMFEDLYGGGDRDFDDLLIAFRPTGVMPLA